MQLPSEYIAKAINIVSKEYGGKRSSSRSGKIIRSGINGHRLYFDIETVDMRISSRLPFLMSFLDEVGYNGVFTASLPIFSEPSGNPAGNPVVEVAAAAGAKQIKIQGATPNTALYTVPGDYLTVSGHTKAYCVAAKMSGSSFLSTQYTSDSNGKLTINLTKPLLQSVAAGETVDFSPLFTLIPDADEWSANIAAANGNFARLKISCGEFF